MGDDDRKDQNLPARAASSLMGQLVRQRQGAEVAPAQPQSTGLAGQGASTGVGGRTSAPPPGQSNIQRQTGSHTGVAPGGAGGRSGLPATEGPSKSDIERIDSKDEFTSYGPATDQSQQAGDMGAKFSANQQLIREREKLII